MSDSSAARASGVPPDARRVGYWTGKRVLIAGGSSGFGRTLAERLVGHGAQVAIAGRSAEKLERAAVELRAAGASGGGLSTHVADVTSDEDVSRLLVESVRALGGLDALIYAAGRSARGAIVETTCQQHRELWELNFLAAVRCARAALPPLCESRGHLVLIGSLAGKFSPRHLGAYPASKAPLNALAQQMRLELRERGVHVLLVCPGPIRRADGGNRYDDQAAGLPAAARQPGGGVRLRGLDPRRLADEVLKYCRQRRVEMVRPRKARLLAALSQIAPVWGDWLLERMMR